MSPARHLSELNRPEGAVNTGGVLRAAVTEDRVDRRSVGGRGSSWRFRNWRVRTKIVAILLIPMLAVITLSGLRLANVATDMRQSSRAEQLAGLAQKATALAHELQAERDLTGAYLGTRRGFGGEQLRTERGLVDKALRDYNAADRELNGDFGPVVSDLLDVLGKHIQQLNAVREAVDKGLTPWPVLYGDYTNFVSDLLKLTEDIPQGLTDPDLADKVRALSAFSRDKALLSSERGFLAYTFGVGRFQETDFRDFLNLDARLQAAQEEFQASTTDAQRKLHERTVSGTTAAAVQRMKEKALVNPTTGQWDVTVDAWYNTTTTVLQQSRAFEMSLGNQVADRAHTLHSDAQRQAILDAGVVLAVFIITLLLALTVARSLVRPLRRLRSTATDIAHHGLPEAVRRLRTTDPGALDAQVELVGIRSTDEVGEVAEAFDSVHRAAVRIAVEQALLRRNVSTMFVNLSRRTQSLVERQLRLIDDLEVNEDDNDSLGNLFQLDHLATRMRRNAENLLVLAGADSGRRWNHPVVLLDVLRAAAAEVEQYPRVAQTYVTNREIDGRAVGDVVHLVAELLENALEFSSPETQVVVSARSLSNDAGVMIEIEDRGIGMSAEELVAANARLASSVEIDVSLSRMMGLYVVGKLASQHGVQVQLRPAASGGVTAHIHLPATIVTERVSSQDEMEQFMLTDTADAPVPVGAGAQTPVRADLGDHETRPIIAERSRSRTWRSRPDEDYGDLLRDHPDDDLLSGSGGGSGPHPLTGGLNGFPAATDRDGASTGSTASAYSSPRNDFGSVDPARGFGSEDTLTSMPAPDLPGTGQRMPQPREVASGPDLPEFDFGGNIADALASTAPPARSAGSQDTGSHRALRDPSESERSRTDLPRPDLSHSERSQPEPPRPALPRRLPPRDISPSDLPPAVTQSVPQPPSQAPQAASQSATQAVPRFDQTQTSLPRRVPQDESSQDISRRPPQQDVFSTAHMPPQGSGDTDDFGRGATLSPAGGPPGASPSDTGVTDTGSSTLDSDVPVPEQAEDEFLPIYAQVESEWFRRRSRPGDAAASQKPPAAAAWQSPADEGWRAAEQIAKPRVSGTTRAGLPVRMPMAHYVPGSAGPGGLRPGLEGRRGPGGGRASGGAAQPGAGTSEPAQGPGQGHTTDVGGQRPADGAAPPAESPSARTPEAVRGLLSSYHRGLRQGREAGRHPGADGDDFGPSNRSHA